ncbi:response regulator [Anthocerotibacter panamensis]|uniref:response regulator n=1 Tax=Anthocerotibacter panamensis TaxID=2857077 RepID=UPI001C401AEB|nr:response regulator transcription factor [Anthocerotibacter panamensis]
MSSIALTVLVVDDHDGFRSSVRQLLERSDHCLRVLEAQSGEECIALVLQDPPDLILMDINLSGQNGLTTTAQVLQHLPKMPIFLITSLEVDEYLEEIRALGAWEIISKCDLSMHKLEQLMEGIAPHVS